jgi:hypothetical protein
MMHQCLINFNEFNYFTISEAFVETGPSYSSVVYHSKNDVRHNSNEGRNLKSPSSRKSSVSNERTRSRNGNDENDNMDFIQEEIAPGKKMMKIIKLKYFNWLISSTGIVIEGYVADL